MAICVYYLVGRCLAGIKCHHKHTGPAFPTPCKNFVLHNTCTWGARCRYAHPTPVAAEDPDPSRSSCKNFLSRRGCKFGSKCLNYHPGAVKKADPSSIPAPPSTQSTTITLIASKATDIVSSILTRDEFASIALASLTESDSTPDLPSLQSITATPAGSKATDIANVKLSRDKPASTVSTPSIESKSTAGLSLPQPTMTKTTASKATDVVNVKLSQDKSASEISAPSTEFSSTPDLSLLPSTTTKLAGSKATDTADVKSSDVEVDTMLASLVNPSSDDAATSPPAQTPLSLDRDQMDATYMRNSYDEFNSTKPAPSINPGSNLTAPPSQSLTSVPASLSNTDEIGDASLTDITSVGGSYELVRSTTRSPSLIDSEYDTSLSTVSEEATTTKLVQSDSGIDLADRVNNNQQFNNFADQSAAPLITPPNDSSTGLGLVSAVQSADLDPPTNQLPSFMDGVTHVHSPNDTILSTATEEISISPLITAPINPNIEPTPASAVESTNPDLPANDFFYKLIAASAAADKQRLEETSSISTNDQTTINKLSPSVIDWSAATTPSNLELEGPGIYGREICHSVVLCTWPQEWNIPAFAIVDALTNLASTFGEIVCQPFYRNAGFSHSLQFKFQHPHEAAAASAQLNNQYINVAGTYMSVQTSVTHQITVTYMIPQYIIESLGRHGQGNLYTLFEQNFCQLQWNNFHRYYLSGELVTEVTIMGMYEGQVAQCKAVLEDLIRGRVLTHEEGDNRPLWHDFFHTEEGTKWLREKTEDAFYLRVRAVRMANLNVLMIYGSSELTRNEFGGIVKKKIAGLVEGDKKTAEISAVVAEEVRLMRLRV